MVEAANEKKFLNSENMDHDMVDTSKDPTEETKVVAPIEIRVID